MAKHVTCPFCGEHRPKTKEHVWAQWMRQSPAAKTLMAGSTGQRENWEQILIAKDANGSYSVRNAGSRKIHSLLPNVTVEVCSDCNSGWMSRLERRTQELIGVFVEGESEQTTLTIEDQRSVATWAMKSWMAYALTRLPQRNPFTSEDYRRIAQSQELPPNSRIWLGYQHDPYVALGLETLLLTAETTHLDRPDNFGFLILGANKVFLVGIIGAPEIPAALMECFSSIVFLDDGPVPQIWPASRPCSYPEFVSPSGYFDGVMSKARGIVDTLGLPMIGHTDPETKEFFDRFQQGENPKSIRGAAIRPRGPSA